MCIRRGGGKCSSYSHALQQMKTGTYALHTTECFFSLSLCQTLCIWLALCDGSHSHNTLLDKSGGGAFFKDAHFTWLHVRASSIWSLSLTDRPQLTGAVMVNAGRFVAGPPTFHDRMLKHVVFISNKDRWLSCPPAHHCSLLKGLAMLKHAFFLPEPIPHLLKSQKSHWLRIY